MRTYLELAQADQITLNVPQLSYLADQKMKRAMIDLQAEILEQAEHIATLENALLVARTLNELPFELNLWQAQNIWYDIWRHKQPNVQGAPDAWLDGFLELGKLLRFSVDELAIDENSHEPAYAKGIPVLNATRITPEITQLTRMGLFNAYLVSEDDGLTLVDTLLKGSSKTILQAATTLGQPVRRILLTHAHGDHVGSLDALAAAIPGVNCDRKTRIASPRARLQPRS